MRLQKVSAQLSCYGGLKPGSGIPHVMETVACEIRNGIFQGLIQCTCKVSRGIPNVCYVYLFYHNNIYLYWIEIKFKCAYYHQTSNIRDQRKKMFLVLSCSCLCPIHWSQVLSQEWRCSWSSADRRCSNYIWVINSFIAYWGVPCIRGLILHD